MSVSAWCRINHQWSLHNPWPLRFCWTNNWLAVVSKIALQDQCGREQEATTVLLHRHSSLAFIREPKAEGIGFTPYFRWLVLNICIHAFNRPTTHIAGKNETKFSWLSFLNPLKNYHKSTDSFPPKTMLHCYKGLLSGWLSGLPIQISFSNKRECVCRCGNKRAGRR